MEKTIQKVLEETIFKYDDMKAEGWLAFMRDELKYTPDPGMDKIIIDIAEFKDTAVRSCHGVGKTTLGANVLLTALALVPELMVGQFSPTWSQVKNVFWKELRKWYANSESLKILFEIGDKAPILTSRISPYTWHAFGIASNSPGKVEGRHAKRVLLIGDEMKAVEDGLVQGIQGALTSKRSWRLYLSTPSTPGGKYTAFYNCFGKNRSMWKTYKITADQSPRVSKQWVDKMISEYGAESQIVKARVYAEFPDAAGDVLIPLQVAEQFYQEGLEPSGDVTMGIDVARFGGDESIISIWKGRDLWKIEVVKEHSEKSRTTDTARVAAELAKTLLCRVIAVDDIGVGGGVTDALCDRKGAYWAGEHCQIVPITASEQAPNPDKFKNFKSEALWEFANELKAEKIRSSVNDDKMVYQMSSYRKKFEVDGRIRILFPENKGDKMSEESSPDRAEAVWMGFIASRLYAATKSDKIRVTKMEEDDPEPDPEFHGINTRSF